MKGLKKMNKQTFLSELNAELERLRAEGVKSPQVLHNVLSDTIMKNLSADWKKSKKSHLDSRRACYFSMEFLIGRSIYNNLLCLDICNEV